MTKSEKKFISVYKDSHLMKNYILKFQANDFYLMKDPDPFDERHPSRIDGNCTFGQILKSFFKKESLVAEIFNNYMRDNYFTRLGQVSILYCVFKSH